MIGAIGRLRSGFRRIYADPEWTRLVGDDWAESVFDLQLSDRYYAKQGRSIARWTIEEGGRRLVAFLKRHIVLPRRDGLLTALFPSQNWSPGWAEHRNLEIARQLGIPVPRVLAAAEFLRPGGQLQSVLAVEELKDMLPLNEAIPLALSRLASAEFDRWKRGLVAELVRLVRLLHDGCWFHKDLYFCHFYIAEGDTVRSPASWTDRVSMIDFHRLGRHRLTAPWWRAKDLGQLLFSSEVPGVTARDRARFWKLYSQGVPIWSPLLRGATLLRARKNRVHNLRRPQAPARAA